MFKKLKKFIFGDLGLKAMALAIAAAVWFYAGNRLREQASIPVPITVKAPEGFQIVHQGAQKVGLWLSGPHSLIARLRDAAGQNELQMVTELTPEQARRGHIELAVKPEWLEVKEWLGITKRELLQLGVAGMQPKHLSVYVSEVISKKLPVKVQWPGEPYPGYEMGQVDVTPQQVTVTGPALLLQRMTAVNTSEILVWEPKSDVRLPRVPLTLEEPLKLEEGLEEVSVSFRCSPARVRVNIAIRGSRVDRTLEGIPVWLLKSSDFPYEVEIPEEFAAVSVVVSGTQEDLKKVTPATLTAYVNLGALTTVKIEPGRSAPYPENVWIEPLPNLPGVTARAEPNRINIMLTNPAE